MTTANQGARIILILGSLSCSPRNSTCRLRNSSPRLCETSFVGPSNPSRTRKTGSFEHDLFVSICFSCRRYTSIRALVEVFSCFLLNHFSPFHHYLFSNFLIVSTSGKATSAYFWGGVEWTVHSDRGIRQMKRTAAQDSIVLDGA